MVMNFTTTYYKDKNFVVTNISNDFIVDSTNCTIVKWELWNNTK